MAKSKRISESADAEEFPRESISMRAFEKWCGRGMPHGSDQQDWYEAEAELRTAKVKTPGSTRPTR